MDYLLKKAKILIMGLIYCFAIEKSFWIADKDRTIQIRLFETIQKEL